jgi:hypothetical protein
MKRRAGILTFLLLGLLSLHAQLYYFDIGKKKDAFTVNFLSLMNDAPNKFIHYKGKMTSLWDTIHLGSHISQLKITLPGTITARYVQDSTYYCEFLMGYYETLEDATTGMNEWTDKISKSLSRRVVVNKHDYGPDGSFLKENKICAAQHSGFFHPNISVQITRVLTNNMYRLAIQLYSGKPYYYYWIAKNEPIGGFNFVNYVKNTFMAYNIKTKGCPVEIPAYTCKGREVLNDSDFINYGKVGFEGFMDARAQYDVTFGNLRASLGSEYVYFFVPYKRPFLKRIAFVRFDDIDLGRRKTLIHSIMEKDKPVITNSYNRKDYEIWLSFVY